MKMWVRSLALLSGLRIQRSVGHRCGLDLVWLWHSLATAALIRPLAWECPYAAGAPPPKKKHHVTEAGYRGGQGQDIEQESNDQTPNDVEEPDLGLSEWVAAMQRPPKGNEGGLLNG